MTRSLARALVPCAALATAACGGSPPGAQQRPVSVVRAVAPAGTAPAAAVAPAAYNGFRDGEKDLTASERAGREIWYKATGGNGRFHTYVFQQRMGVLIDWYRVLQSPKRDDRFAAWGLINDPDCCTPGSQGCPATSLEQTYGFDWCPGDETLLAFVGKSGYRDPACDFKDADGTPRQDACDLAFGTSTGALGLRKFPNPRFDAARWQSLGGAQPGTWDGYAKQLTTAGRKGRPGVRDSRLLDGSVEPPFLVGMACGACHISFDPTRPPQDPAHPKWENLLGAVGNQYARFSEIMASGMAKDSPEWQIFTHARPGTVDTSAVPNDQVHNPGTMNAIFNTSVRPTFADEAVPKWRRVAACEAGAPAGTCWCEPGREGKCWSRSVQKTRVPHLLKGGEDSIGLEEAVQRVYFNIGVCSEECWVNHLTDFRQIDPEQRNFGQTPFDIGQCRRDCPNFRAIEDRLSDVTAFLQSKETRPPDLAAALKKDSDGLVDWLNRELAPGTVDRGRVVFAETCARCHSSQPGAADATAADFRRVAGDPTLRVDWLGNDQATPVSEVQTFECRALHSNHMEGHVWQEYGSDSYRARPADSTTAGATGGGRGYYRNVSLLGTWAFAPFMHNNAIGPEVCGRPRTKENDFYLSPYVTAEGAPAPAGSAPPCVPYDPSVAARFALYRASMEDLLNPDRRARKVSLLDEDINLDVGPRTWDGEKEEKIAGVTLTFRKGLPASFFGNFQHKPFFDDLIVARTRPQDLKAKYVQRFGAAKGEAVAQEIRKLSEEIGTDFSRLAEIARPHLDTLKDVYLSCGAVVENDGHRFGEALSPEDKKALIAFLATL
jgi:mono/diheme cytochrome c family protein